MLKVSDVSPLSALGPGVQLMPRVVGGAREKGAGLLGLLGPLWVPAAGPGHCGPSPTRIFFSPGPVCPVLVVTTLPLRPAAVPEAGGLQVLRSLVQEKGMEVLAVRVVTLLYDLVTEKVSAWGLATPPSALCVLLAI